jgi:hypothetical protein
MGVRTHDHPGRTAYRGASPSALAAVATGGVAFVLLIANARPLGPSDETGLAGWLLRPVLAAAGLALDLDATGRALVGKLLAAACAAAAAGALFAAVARRHPSREARLAGLVLALGTSLAAAAQSWTGEAPATAAVAFALWLLVRADSDDDPAVAGRAAVPLAAAVALQPSAWVLALLVLVAVVVRFPRSTPRTLAWAVPAAAAAAMLLLGEGGGSAAAAGVSPLALLVSPGRGALVFTPVALVGVAGALRAAAGRGHRLWDAHPESRWLATTLLVAALAHIAFVAVWASGGTRGTWGPALFAPAWALLLLFLPEGTAALRLLGGVLVVISLGIQALGAFAGDDRWSRLYGPASGSARSPWTVVRSPIVFTLHERVVRLAVVSLDGGRLVVREHPVRLLGPTGSRVTFAGDEPEVDGVDATLGDVLLERGARIEDGRLRLSGPGDALFLRVREAARPRRLELRVRGRGAGTLIVEEATFHTAPRVLEEKVGRSWRVRRPYEYAESGGGDVRLRTGGGTLEIESVALVPPGEPENVIRQTTPGTHR